MAKAKSNPRVAAATVKHKAPSDDAKPVRQVAQEASYDTDSDFVGIAEEVAESKVVLGNWEYDEGEAAFPYEVHFRTVDMCFPFATGGPLLIDEVDSEDEVELLERKAKVLREAGYRYVIITPSTDLQDANAQIELTPPKAREKRAAIEKKERAA